MGVYLLNIFIVLLVLLIAYWWGSQGIFSALLHLLCVIVAGAIALALWEPVTVNLLLRGTWFDQYAWGVSLLGMFAILLLGLRVISDKTVRANVNTPEWANYAIGMPIGAAAGVLTLGILFIGSGFMQSFREIGGYQGYGRSARTAEVTRVGPGMWLPVHQWTSEFYSWLSGGALYPTFTRTPLNHFQPELHKQASLVRDTFISHRNQPGQVSLPPEAVQITTAARDNRTNRHVFRVEFSTIARDFGEMLTLSRSQIRLICWPHGGSNSTPIVVHPDAWRQDTSEGPGRFLFDDPSHYITSVPGRQDTWAEIEFPVPAGAVPRFLQIRNNRYRLTEIVDAAEAGISIGQGIPDFEAGPVTVTGGADISSVIEVRDDIRPAVGSVNQMPGNLRHHERRLTEGHGTFRRGGMRPGRRLAIEGVHEPDGTRVVQVDVSRDSPANIYGDIRRRVGDNAPVQLVDSQGNVYDPIGYIHRHQEGTTIRLEPSRLLRSAEELPLLPTAGTDQLRLVYRVTQGITIVGMRYGDVTVGTCNLEVRAARR